MPAWNPALSSLRSYCGENGHQCRHCRNINYGHLDAFLCAECGYSRHCRLEHTLIAAPAWEHAPLGTEQQVRFRSDIWY